MRPTSDETYRATVDLMRDDTWDGDPNEPCDGCGLPLGEHAGGEGCPDDNDRIPGWMSRLGSWDSAGGIADGDPPY